MSFYSEYTKLVTVLFQLEKQFRKEDETTTTEIEIRIVSYFITKEVIKKFITKYEKYLTETKYIETRIKEKNQIKRIRVPGKSEIKKKMCSFELSQLWATVHLSYEKETKIEDKELKNVTERKITRYQLVEKRGKIEIGICEEDSGFWFEIEKINTSTPESMVELLCEVIKELQSIDMETQIKTVKENSTLVYKNEYFVIKSIFEERIKKIPKPISLHKNNTNKLSECKRISIKLDGVRIFVIIRMNKIYFVSLKNSIISAGNSKHYNELLILDCEILENGKIYVLDIPVINNQYVGRDPKRMNFLGLEFEKKVWFQFTSQKQIFDLYEKNKDRTNIDGIILMGDIYDENILKWKPFRSIDLKYYNNSLLSAENIKIKIENMKDFENLENNSIYEFVVNDNDGRLTVLRKREDRLKPNSIKTINDILGNENFLEIKKLNMDFRNITNKQKREILQKYRNKKILDIGSGQGGDINKWVDLNITVTAIEPDKNQCIEFERRLSEKKYKKITLKNCTIEDFITTTKEEKYNCVTAFFCMNLIKYEQRINIYNYISEIKADFVIICMTEIQEMDNENVSIKKKNDKEYTISIFESRIIDKTEEIITKSELQFHLKNYSIEESKINSFNVSRNEQMLLGMYSILTGKYIKSDFSNP